MAMSDTMRAAAIAALLLAGSCAAPTNDQATLVSDPDTNHPIVVNPTSQSVRVSYSATDAGLTPEDAARLDEFVSAYLASGDRAISITVPSGPVAQQTIHYFGERLASAGVPRSRIMVGTRNDNDPRVELNYVAYTAHTDTCGNWSQNANDTGSNLPMPDFGCSVQHNIAAQVEDARDIAVPRPMGVGDAMRRSTVIGAYEKGAVTAATKTADQSAAISDVGH